MDRITVFCFVASYTLALLFELLRLWLDRAWLRFPAALAAAAGLVAHTLFLYSKRPPLIWQFSWMLFVSWVLTVFYLTAALHHRRTSWGLFVLPLILGLVGLGTLFGVPPAESKGLLQGDTDAWVPVHVILLFLASIGLCVGFLASVMYLFQAYRLRTKAPPGEGLKLLSLERLEDMNRRALFLAFPLLTAGMIAGLVLLLRIDAVNWTDPRVISTGVQWVVFALLLFLRLAHFLKARQVAMMTIVSFLLLIVVWALPHSQPHKG